MSTLTNAVYSDDDDDDDVGNDFPAYQVTC